MSAPSLKAETDGFQFGLIYKDAHSGKTQSTFFPGDRVKYIIRVNIPQESEGKKATLNTKIQLKAGRIKLPFKISSNSTGPVADPGGKSIDLPYSGELVGEFTIPREMPASTLMVTTKLSIQGIGSKSVTRYLLVR